MLSENMISQLNKQINLEIYSSNMYLQMGAWCSYQSLDGCANFLTIHADEEMTHMRRLLGYLQETGALAKIGGTDAPPIEFASVTELFEKIYAHEQFVTRSINELVHLANTEPDYSTLQFLQWYVAEQHQEEFLFKSILDKIKLIGTESQGLFFIDQEVGKLATNPGNLEATTATAPA
ncbi:MAG: non-heme ferritin [Cyanobacteria bacterium P01_H01_bin.15]